jgi:hypothetical protein
MAPQLPEDLERLGTSLTVATTRAAAAKRRRRQVNRRVATCLAAGLLVLAASPSHLGPAQPPAADLLGLEDAYGSVSRDPCDPPHGVGEACHEGGPPPQAR